MKRTALKQIWCFLLTLILLLPAASYAESLTTDEAYWKNIEQLSIYLRNDPEKPVDIVEVRTAFEELRLYQFSTEFSLYAQILELLEKDDFHNATSWVNVLKLYPAFDQYVTSETFSLQYPEIRGLTELEAYVNARREEAALNYNAAATYYSTCLKCFDAMDRYKNLAMDLDAVVAEILEQIKAGDYSNALKNAEHLIENDHELGQALYDVAKAKMSAMIATSAPTQAPAATPAPTQAPTSTPAPTQAPTSTPVIVVVTATAAPTKTWGKWSSWSTTPVYANATREVQYNKQYRAREIKTWQEYSDWGSWSEWSTTATNPSETTEVETRRVFRYRDTTYQTEYEWSSWSEWSTEPVSSSASCEVETRTETKDTYTTQYKYKKWHYWTTKGVWYNAPVELYNSSIFSDEKEPYWDYKTTDEPLAVAGTTTANGKSYTYYTGYWYYVGEEQVLTDSKTITYYRYRTRTEKQIPVTGSWSEWSASYPAESSTREIEEMTQYRFRTRTLETKTGKGEWSAWSDNPISESSSLEVETRLLYRYRILE